MNLLKKTYRCYSKNVFKCIEYNSDNLLNKVLSEFLYFSEESWITLDSNPIFNPMEISVLVVWRQSSIIIIPFVLPP